MKNRYIFYAIICGSILIKSTYCASIDPTEIIHNTIRADSMQQACTVLQHALAQNQTSEPNILLYNTLFDSFNRKESLIHHAGVQILIQYLFNKAQPSSVFASCTQALYATLGLSTNQYALLASNILSQYLKLNVKPDHILTIKEALNSAAFNTISKPRLLNTLQASIYTGFASPIDVADIHLKVIFDTDTPTNLRVQLLDNIFLKHILEKKSLYTIAQETTKINDYPLKAYVQAFLTTLSSYQSSADYCTARSCITTLATKYPDTFTENPETLTYCFGKFFRAFQSKTKQNDSYLVQINNTFKNTNFSANKVCFGYAKQDVITGPSKNYLYACNKYTGLPIWIYPQCKQHPYAISHEQNKVYCATDDDTIAVLNGNDGRVLEHIEFDEPQDAQRIEICKDKLFILTNKYIRVANLKQKKYITITLPADAKLDYASFIDDILIIPTPHQFIIIDDPQTPQLIDHYSDDQPRMYGTSTYMLYHKIDQGKSFLVCLDTKTKKELWQHPLGAQLQTEGCPIQCSDTSIFALTQKAILALDTHIKKNKPYKRMDILVEGTPVVNSIHLAKDGMTLYGINKALGQLYAFDAQTGCPKWVGKSKSGQCTIMGLDNNTVYLKLD